MSTFAEVRAALIDLQNDARFNLFGQFVAEAITAAQTDLETEPTPMGLYRLQGRIDALREMHRYVTAPHTMAIPGADQVENAWQSEGQPPKSGPRNQR